MALPDISALSLAAAGFYLCVVLAALGAARASIRRGAPVRERRIWALAAGVFIALAAMRAIAAEDHLRGILRSALELAGARDARRAIQLPLSLAAIALAGLATIPLACRIVRRGWASPLAASDWAALALIGMAVLIGLRVISLHAVDGILFSALIGPLRINWLLDLGCAGITLAAALHYMRSGQASASNGR